MGGLWVLDVVFFLEGLIKVVGFCIEGLQGLRHYRESFWDLQAGSGCRARVT